MKGRCLSDTSVEKFSGEWVYQRFINKSMHRFHSPSQPWYDLQVDHHQLERTSYPVLVVMTFSVLSPLLFPVVFGGATLALTLFLPCSLKYLEDSKVERRDIVRVMLLSFGYFWLSTFPWIFLSQGTYACHTNHRCTEVDFHMSPVAILAPWIACFFAAFRMARGPLLSASACKCEVAHKRALTDDKLYGRAMAQIVNKLSDHADKLSFYPVFTKEENEEPVKGLPPSWTATLLIIAVSMVQGIVPPIWMPLIYGEAIIPSTTLEFFTVLTCIIGASVEACAFLFSLHDSIKEYADVVDEIYIFMFVSGRASSKRRPSARKKFRQIVGDSDIYRKEHSRLLEMQSGRGTLQFLSRKGERFEGDSWGKLHVHQVAFNFARKEGVLLFKKMRSWICTDILNERFEVELLVNLLLLVIALSVLVLGLQYLVHREVCVLWFLVPFDVFVAIFFVLRALNLCIDTNEYLFDLSKRILLEWEEDAVGFGNKLCADMEADGRGPAIAWTWSSSEQRPEPVPYPAELLQSAADTHEPAVEVMNVMVKQMESLEKKQTILGMAVTTELRNRIIASLVSLLGGLVASLPRVIEEHQGRLADMVWHVGASV